MGFTLIKGTFQLAAGIPDGDSVRFLADDDRLFDRLQGRPVEFRTDGTVMLRYEGIDAIEKTAIQPLASQAKEKNFALLREQDDPHSDAPRGFILSRQTDSNRRPVSFAFAGESVQDDGTDSYLDEVLLRQSVNHKMVASGYAYTMFYETLYMELRKELTVAYQQAKQQALGVHQTDATLTGVQFSGRESLSTMPPIFPKLWRRLEEYSRNHNDLADFHFFLQARVVDRLFTVSDARYITFDNVVEINGDQLRLRYEPDDMVFRPA